MKLCDFHREQAWERWLNKKTNDCSGEKDLILPYLRSIARSATDDDLKTAMQNLYKSKYWIDEKFKKFKKYISEYWLPIKEVRNLHFAAFFKKHIGYCCKYLFFENWNIKLHFYIQEVII